MAERRLTHREATTYQGQLYVFVRGTDNKIYLNRLTGSSAWTGWSEVPGGGIHAIKPSSHLVEL